MTVFENMSNKEQLKEAFLAGKRTKTSDDVGMSNLERKTGIRQFERWYDLDYQQE